MDGGSKTEEERWNAQMIDQMKGSPWKPYAFTEDDKLRVWLPRFSEDKHNGIKERRVAEDPAPRAFGLIKRGLITYGYTPYRPGCYPVKNLMSHKPHTPMCRERIRKRMKADEPAAQKIKDAINKQESWLERSVEEHAIKEDVKIDDKGMLLKTRRAKTMSPNVATTDEEMHDPRVSAMDKALIGDDFYKKVNMDFEERLNGIPDESATMHDDMVGLLRAHVAEVDSPPRVRLGAKTSGMLLGFSMDLQRSDEDGNAWDFDIPEQRANCKAKLIHDKPYLLIGSPTCAVCCIMQHLNRERMGEAKRNAMWQYGLKHLLSTLELYEIQLEQGGYMLHGHPQSATNWHVPELEEFMQRHNLQ